MRLFGSDKNKYTKAWFRMNNIILFKIMTCSRPNTSRPKQKPEHVNWSPETGEEGRWSLIKRCMLSCKTFQVLCFQLPIHVTNTNYSSLSILPSTFMFTIRIRSQRIQCRVCLRYILFFFLPIVSLIYLYSNDCVVYQF